MRNSATETSLPKYSLGGTAVGVRIDGTTEVCPSPYARLDNVAEMFACDVVKRARCALRRKWNGYAMIEQRLCATIRDGSKCTNAKAALVSKVPWSARIAFKMLYIHDLVLRDKARAESKSPDAALLGDRCCIVPPVHVATGEAQIVAPASRRNPG